MLVLLRPLLHVALLQLQKPLSLTLQLPKRLPPNLLPKRMTLNCCRSAWRLSCSCQNA
jgi:hypothetical protein